LAQSQGVNRLALAQAEKAQKAHDEFSIRRDRAQADFDKLEELLDSIDEKRQEKVNFTFGQV